MINLHYMLLYIKFNIKFNTDQQYMLSSFISRDLSMFNTITKLIIVRHESYHYTPMNNIENIDIFYT